MSKDRPFGLAPYVIKRESEWAFRYGGDTRPRGWDVWRNGQLIAWRQNHADAIQAFIEFSANYDQ